MQVNLLGKHIGKTADEIERVISRPTYFNPYEAVDFGIIDRVRCSLLMWQRFRIRPRVWPCHVKSSRDVMSEMSAVRTGHSRLHRVPHVCVCVSRYWSRMIQ